MRTIYRYLSSFCLVTTLVLSVGSAGCTGEVRIRDEDHDDWHHWNHNEDHEYRRYLGERHEEYRDYSKLDRDEQHDYWNWRHGPSDSGRH